VISGAFTGGSVPAGFPGCVQNDHRESRSSRITCAADRPVRIGLASRERSSHSAIVGRSATRASSFLRKSERLIPSRAALALSVPCNFSGTSRNWIIFAMFSAYKHVLHMHAYRLTRARESASSCRSHSHCCRVFGTSTPRPRRTASIASSAGEPDAIKAPATTTPRV